MHRTILYLKNKYHKSSLTRIEIARELLITPVGVRHLLEDGKLRGTRLYDIALFLEQEEELKC